ncbi:acetylxylan esterase [Rariglobus hedericola]|nr:acetylxylan esterase [Rariglobus hedericola]
MSVLFAIGLVPIAKAAPSSYALSVTAERDNATYRVDETVTFIVTVTRDGQPHPEGEISWSLTKDGVAPILQGTAPLKEGKALVTGRLSEPGFLQCKAKFDSGTDSVKNLGAAAIDPLKLRPSLPVPDDFDAFWESKKRILAAIPLNAKLTPVPTRQAGIELFDVEADSVGDRPMRGYYARPANAAPKSLPAIITLEGAGVYSTRLEPWLLNWAKAGFISLELNAHGLPNGREPSYYQSLEQGALKDYPFFGRESRETSYFLNMYLRALRGVDFLTAQPEWDGRVLISSGLSQGAAQAIFVASQDRRVTFLSAGVPAMCDHTAMLVGRVPGWPRLVPAGPDGKPAADVIETSRYFDSVNFASRVRAPSFFVIGYNDQVTPPTAGYVACNNLRAEKEIYPAIHASHALQAPVLEVIRQRILAHKTPSTSTP